MSTDFLRLQSKHVQLQLDYDKVKAGATGRFFKYYPIHKLNGDGVKVIEPDIQT